MKSPRKDKKWSKIRWNSLKLLRKSLKIVQNRMESLLPSFIHWYVNSTRTFLLPWDFGLRIWMWNREWNFSICSIKRMWDTPTVDIWFYLSDETVEWKLMLITCASLIWTLERERFSLIWHGRIHVHADLASGTNDTIPHTHTDRLMCVCVCVLLM